VYRKILVAVDGSGSSKRALDEALRLAKLAHAEVRVVHIVDKSPLFMYAGYYDPVALMEALRANGGAVLDAARDAMAAQRVAGDVEAVETESLADDVAQCLLRYTENHGADLVAMGTHGRRGVQRLVLGSVAERFLRVSHCPVLLTRDTA